MPDTATAPAPGALHDAPISLQPAQPPTKPKGYAFTQEQRAKGGRNCKQARAKRMLANCEKTQEIATIALQAFRDTLSGGSPDGSLGKLSREDAAMLSKLMGRFLAAQSAVAFWSGAKVPNQAKGNARQIKGTGRPPAPKPKNLPPGDPEVE